MGPRRKAKRDRPSEVASHQNAGPNDSEDQHLPNDRSDEHPDPLPTRRLTILYGERNLQTTIDLDASFTISEAKEMGSDQLLTHLHKQPYVPPGLTFDDDCTEFFPGIMMNRMI